MPRAPLRAKTQRRILFISKLVLLRPPPGGFVVFGWRRVYFSCSTPASREWGALALLELLVFRPPWNGRSFVATAPVLTGVSGRIARTPPRSILGFRRARIWRSEILLPAEISRRPPRTHCRKRLASSCANSLPILSKLPRSRTIWPQNARCAPCLAPRLYVLREGPSKRDAGSMFCAKESSNKGARRVSAAPMPPRFCRTPVTSFATMYRE